MGLLASIFNSNNNTIKNRQKNRNFRICRIEEMESRDLLSASPYDPPCPPEQVHFDIAFHDGACNVDMEQQANVDSFLISWHGGDEGTWLQQLVHTKITQ